MTAARRRPTSSPGGSFLLRADAVMLPGVMVRPGYVVVDAGVIRDAGLGRGPSSADTGVPVVEVEGVVVGGFVDVHVHGGDGYQVNGDSVDEVVVSVDKISRFLARHGTTSWLATTVSDSTARLRATVSGVAEARRRGVSGARPRGVHLEGPWLARAKTGAQDPAALRRPDRQELRELCELAPGLVQLVTLAPELPGAFELIEVARSHGAKVAMGHSDASFEVAEAAIAAGVSHATHLFNAMAPLHHRRPGVVGAALIHEHVTLELIADCEHVHPAVLHLVAKMAPLRIVLVSDAVPAAGMEPGRYQLGPQEVVVSGERVTLAADPATLAGSVLSLDRAVMNLAAVAGVPMSTAVRAASLTPAHMLGWDGVGAIEPGGVADLAVLDELPGRRTDAIATLIGGLPVHDPLGAFAAVGSVPSP